MVLAVVRMMVVAGAETVVSITRLLTVLSDVSLSGAFLGVKVKITS